MINLKELSKQLLVLDAKQNPDFLGHTLDKTSKRSILLSLVIFMAEILMIGLTFAVPSYFTEELIQLYRIHYYILSLISLTALLFAYLHRSGKVRSLKVMEYFLMFLVLVCICWGGSISLLDQINSSQISVYLTFMNLMAVGALLAPSKMLVIFIGVEILFIHLLPRFQSNDDLVFGIGLNSIFFVLFAFLISRQFYVEEYNNFLKDLVIKDQNHSLTEQNQRLLYISKIDPLTKLYNRQSLDDILTDMVNKETAPTSDLHFLMMDVDRFKQLNDQYGHIAGDKCLRMISHQLKLFADNHEGFAFRYGGDEFLFFMILPSGNSFPPMIDELKHSLESTPIIVEDDPIYIKMSIGHSFTPLKDDLDPWLIIHEADQKLYLHKTQK